MYRIVRVNNDSHPDMPHALWDATTIIERGYWWRMNEDLTTLTYGTPIIGMGCYGGAGLFMLGIVSGEWEAEPDGGPWHRRVPVVWQPVIYSHGSGAAGKLAVKKVDNMLGVHVVRSNMELSKEQFRQVLDFVLKGKVLEANFTEPGQEAA